MIFIRKPKLSAMMDPQLLKEKRSSSDISKCDEELFYRIWMLANTNCNEEKKYKLNAVNIIDTITVRKTNNYFIKNIFLSKRELCGQVSQSHHID